MDFVISGVGLSVPPHAVVQEEAAAFAAERCEHDTKHRRLVPTLYRRSGVKKRHSVLLTTPANGASAEQDFYPPMNGELDRGPTTARRMQAYDALAAQLAVGATAEALEQTDIPASEITHLVTVSCSGFSAPGFDIALVGELGLPAEVARTHIGFMGCHGALNGIRVAKAYGETDPAARVLVCAVELCTLHHQYGGNPDRIVSNALFADGAAAVVGQGAEAGAADDWRVVACGSSILPETRDLMGWRIGDHGFEMNLSPRVPDVILHSLRPWLEDWLAKQGFTVEAIGSWAIHPGGPRILDACCEAIGLKDADVDASRSVLADYGNMSSPTVLFILSTLREAMAPRPCVMLAFGPGLTIEAALIQ